GPFQIGDGIFNRNWAPVPGPEGNDGLGPTFNAISCSSCHVGGGRGSPPDEASPKFLGLLLRLSVPGTSEHGGPAPDPGYGDQLQPYGVFGVPGEGAPVVTYVEMPGTYGDGTAYSLRAPTYSVIDPSFGPLGAGGLVSPRLAPQPIGEGLLAAIDES